MLSPDLAELYHVETRVLVQAVKRNRSRFPEDFMFQLTRTEYDNLKSQFVISSWGGSRRAAPYAFTEQGVAMLSAVLRSRKAVQVSIAIVRVFMRLREMLASHKELSRRMSELEQLQQKQGLQITQIYNALRGLMAPEKQAKKPHKKTRRRIGFPVNGK